MPREDKPTLDITNRPSTRKRHSHGEWVHHLEVRESVDARRDIHDARSKLGQFTVRYVAEAMFGDRVAAQIFGDDGGNELIADMVIDKKTLRTLAGNVGGERARAVVEKTELREIQPAAAPVVESKDVSQQQVELLRALLKTMDPEVVKKALTGG